MTRSSESSRTGGRSLNRLLALGVGAGYVVVSVLGVLVADTFAGTDDGAVLGVFEVNHLHNLVHLLVGLALVATSIRVDTARGANLAIGVTYVALAALGPFVTGTDRNVLALNGPDHLLHLASGLLLAGVALGADRTRV